MSARLSLDLLDSAINAAELGRNSENAVEAAACRQMLSLLLPIRGSIIAGEKSIKRLHEVLQTFCATELTIYDNGDETDFKSDFKGD